MSTKGDDDIRHSLFQREDDGRFVLGYVPKGATWSKAKQITAPKEITSRPKAAQWARKKLAEIRSAGGVLASARRGTATLRDVHERLMRVRANLPDIKAASIKNNWTHLRTQILGTSEKKKLPPDPIADMAMADVGVSEARAFVRRVRARNSPNHTRNIFSTARALWDVAQGEGIIQTINPFRNALVIAEVPAGKNLAAVAGIIDPIIVPLPVVQALIDAPDELVPLERRVRYLIAAAEGFDDGEIAGLAWEHRREGLEPAADGSSSRVPFFAVRQALAMRGRKGNVTLETPKTENRLRDVPLHPAVIAAEKDWREGWERHACRKPTAHDFLFVREELGRQRPHRPASAELLRRDIARLNARAHERGEPPVMASERLELITFKSLRRTFSSSLKNAGVEPEDRGKLMGHAGETVTARNYTFHELARLAELVARIPLRWAREEGAAAPTAKVPRGKAAEPVRSSASPVRTGSESARASTPEVSHNVWKTVRNRLEARIGFEPTYDGFAIRPEPVREGDGGEESSDKTVSAGAPRDGTGYRDGQGARSSARSRTVPRAEASAAVGKSGTHGKPSHSRARPGVAKAAAGAEGVRVEVDGRVLARTEVAPGEPIEAVEARLRAAVGRRGGVPR